MLLFIIGFSLPSEKLGILSTFSLIEKVGKSIEFFPNEGKENVRVFPYTGKGKPIDFFPLTSSRHDRHPPRTHHDF